MPQFSTTLLPYVKAYLRHVFQSVTWVTLVCAFLTVILLLIPQSAELILSQATLPEAGQARLWFGVRIAMTNFAALVLAFSVWLSARMLISTEWMAQRPGEHAPAQALPTYRQSAAHSTPADAADAQAALWLPRHLGLTIFLTLQVAAARSISAEGYSVPIVLVAVWLSVLVLGLMRVSGVEGKRLRSWWISLLGATAILPFVAGYFDLRWIGGRAKDDVWTTEQYQAIGIMGGGAILICLVLIALAPWVTRAGASRKRQAVATLATLAAIVGCFIAAGVFEDTQMYWLFFFVQSVAALFYWAAVVGRRKALVRLKQALAAAPLGKRVLDADAAKMTRWISWGVAVLTLAFVGWACGWPLGMGKLVGALGIVLMFFAFLVLTVAWLQASIGRSSWRAAVPAGSVVVGLLVMLLLWPTEPQYPPQEPDMRAVSGQLTLQQRLRKLPDDGQQIFALAAHGGGIRAALYTASFAAWLDHYTQHQFSRRLLAASGASGGSLGLAVWAAAHAAGCADKKWNDEEKTVPPCVQAVKEMLAQDHLSPLLATGLFRDYILFLARPERGNTLQESIKKAASALSPEVLDGVDVQLAGALTNVTYPFMLNASEVETAIPYALVTHPGMLPLAPPDPERYLTYVPSSASGKVSLLTAAMHSARFPLISPKGMVARPDGPTVVDGGYFDNSGVAVLRQHILGLQSHYRQEMQAIMPRLVVISLDNEPIPSREPRATGADRNSVDEIVGTILAARAAHGYAAWYQLCTDQDMRADRMFSARPGAPLKTGCKWPSELDDKDGAPLWQRQHETHGPALGWSLSPRSARKVMDDAREKARTVAVRSGFAEEADPPKEAAMQQLLRRPLLIRKSGPAAH